MIQLPDYHDIIENPMDFGTLRNKLDGGLYSNLEQFEVGSDLHNSASVSEKVVVLLILHLHS